MQLLVIIVVVLVLLSSQPLLLTFGLVTLFVIFKLFWLPFHPKTIFFGLLLFWLSIIVKLFYADLNGFTFEELSISPNILQTAYLSMVALNVFAFGIHIMTKQIKQTGNNAVLDVNSYNTQKVLLVYVVSIVFKTVIGSLGNRFGLGEVFRALLLLRSGFVFVMIYIYYKKNNNLVIPLLLILIEVFLSFFSYFSSFKDILISFLVAFTYFKIELKAKQLFFLTVVGAGCLYLLLVWQAVKGNYRMFLSGGERSQAVVVNRGDALQYFFDLASTADVNDADLFYQSIDRLSYIEFFSEATDNVPSSIPHEDGALWKQNITHVLVPRILNPNKKAIYDSEMVNKYATRKVAGADVGTSFSLGFLAESYIDYGYVFMYVPVFLLGIFFGFIYRYIMTKSLNHIWGCAFVCPLWVYFNCNGTAGAKILGWMIFYVIIFFLINKFIVKPLDNFLRLEVDTTPSESVVLDYN